MKIIKVRSPFFVTVNETLQIGSKVELFIWNKGTTEPTVPTYTLSKPIASINQIENNYNISNYIREYIKPVKPTLVTVPTVEENDAWAICKVKRYKLVGTTYTLLDIIEYVCIDGFTNYSDGKQNAIDDDALPLVNGNILSTYSSNGYLNLICQRSATENLNLFYIGAGAIGTIESRIVLSSGSPAEYFNYKIPFKSSLSSLEYQYIYLAYGSFGSIFFEKITNKLEECRYTPVICSFINRYGGWEFLTFFKQQTNSIAIKSTDYKLMPSSINYNTSIGQEQRFNINGKQSVKLNTGFVDENYSELITDLLLSENVLLDNNPVTLKTQGSDLKTVLKDRMINYEIDFEYSYNLINDVV